MVEVDCSGDGKSLCEEHGIESWPTIQWGLPDDLEDCFAKRKFEDLKIWFDKYFKPVCMPTNVAACSEKEKAQLERIQAMPYNELKEKIAYKEAKIQEAIDEFEKSVQGLQKTYRQETEGLAEDSPEVLGAQSNFRYNHGTYRQTKEKTIAEIRHTGLPLAKAVLKHRKEEAGKD